MNSLVRLQGYISSRSCRLIHQRAAKFCSPRLYSTDHYSNRDLYELLGVKKDASQAEIKTSFYELSKIYHPDVTSDIASRSKFFEISEAYEILGNAKLRHNYDKGLLIAKPGVVYSESSVPPVGEMMKTGRIHGGVDRRHRQYKEPPGGYSAMYDFDEFYKNHYHQRLISLRAQEYSRDRPNKDPLTGSIKKNLINIILLFVTAVPVAKYFYTRYQWNSSDFIIGLKEKALSDKESA